MPLGVGPEFTKSPLIIDIGLAGQGHWHIQPSDQDVIALNGKQMKHSQRMMERADILMPEITKHWNDHKRPNSPAGPHFTQNAGHVPTIVLPGERVQFKSNYPFVIWAARDPDVDAMPNSPENPFGFTKPVLVDKNNFLSAPFDVPMGVAVQRFYKCTAWVLYNGQFVEIDPDVVGGN